MQQSVFEPLDPYYSDVPLSPRYVRSQHFSYLPNPRFTVGLTASNDVFSPPFQGGQVRSIGKKRGYSKSASNTPLIPIKPSAVPKRPVAHRQRGYSDASSFSDYTAAASALSTCPSQIIKKDMIAQYPAGPGGNPRLNNSALQGI